MTAPQPQAKTDPIHERRVADALECVDHISYLSPKDKEPYYTVAQLLYLEDGYITMGRFVPAAPTPDLELQQRLNLSKGEQLETLYSPLLAWATLDIMRRHYAPDGRLYMSHSGKSNVYCILVKQRDGHGTCGLCRSHPREVGQYFCIKCNFDYLEYPDRSSWRWHWCNQPGCEAFVSERYLTCTEHGAQCNPDSYTD